MSDLFDSRTLPPPQVPASTDSSKHAPEAGGQPLETAASVPIRNYAQSTVDLLRDASSFRAARDVLDMAANALSGFKKLDGNTYSYEDLKFLLTLSGYGERECAALKIANLLQLGVAPTFVDHISYAGGESILVTSLAHASGGQPVPLREWTKPLAPEARAHFLDDMYKLAKAGFYLPDAGKGTYDWEIVPATGEIVIGRWARLEKLELSNVANVLGRFRDLTGRL